MDDELYLSDVAILCTECFEPIKARINTPQWIRVEFISPDGVCQKCVQAKKKQGKGLTNKLEEGR